MSHTPGPWVFSESDSTRYISTPSVGPHTNIMGDTDSDYPWTPDKDDDWRLIAAAPDMLAALKSIDRLEVSSNTWRRIQSAIAKAEGK